MEDGRRYSDAGNAKDRAAWPIVSKHCPEKAQAQCREIIRTWVAHGVLKVEEYYDQKDRKDVKGLFVNNDARGRAREE
jgi:hypothetical protein